MATKPDDSIEKSIASTEESTSEEIGADVTQPEKNNEPNSDNNDSTQTTSNGSEISIGPDENDLDIESIESNSDEKADKREDTNSEESMSKDDLDPIENIASNEILSTLEDEIMLDDSDSMEDLLDSKDEDSVGQKRKRDSDEIFERKIEFKKSESDTDSSDDEQMTFSDAEKRIKELKKIPSDHNVLLAYALHKQSIEGDNETEYPLPLDFVGKAKWETWNDLKGLTKEVAKKKYINLVKHLEHDS